MLKGSCCCGAIQFDLAEMPTMMGTCHCSRCRKVGASTFVFVKSEDFRITAGRDHITCYKAEPPYKYNRCFCSVCGSALGEILSDSESFPLAANCIDGDIEIENRFHEFVSEKPSWLMIDDHAKRFEGHPFKS